MTRKLMLISVLLCYAAISFGQSYKWIKGGGSAADLSAGGQWEQVTQMCADYNGNVYITANVGVNNILADTFYRALAHNAYPGTVHILFASYRCDGTMRWAKLIECWDITKAGGLAYDNGSVYLAGCLMSEAPGHNKYLGDDTVMSAAQNYSSYTARFDTSGKFKWIRYIGPNLLSTVFQTGDPGVLAIDGQGHIHNFNLIREGCAISSSFTTTVPGTYDVKYDTAGNLLGASQIPALDSVWMLTKAVFNKQSNKWYATIQPYYGYWVGNWNSAVCAFRTDNSQVWRDTTGVAGAIVGIDYKSGNELYVSGAGQYPGGFTLGGIPANNTVYGNIHAYAVLFRLDTNGAGHWVYNLQGNSSIISFNNVAIVPGEKIAAIGTFVGPGIHGTDTIKSTVGEQVNPLFLVIDSAGHTLKLDQLHGPGYNDVGDVIASDKAGNIYLGGELESSMTATGLSPYSSNGGNTDFFIARYGYDCICLTSIPAASFTSTITGTGGYTMACTYTGTAGTDSVKWTFGDGGTSILPNPAHTYTASGTYNVCVTIYTPCGTDSHCSTVTVGSTGINPLMSGNVKVYPNPNDGQLVIEHAGEGTLIRIFDMPGRMLYEEVAHNEKELLDTTPFPAGTYFLQLTDTQGNRGVRTIVRK